mmetsp:Transcript_7598/g.17833  ORF Transcript_7598/g.17833 Transcript_7598/m.17833 type:complete len:418 (-) Transcript_7598:182-1435(-)
MLPLRIHGRQGGGAKAHRAALRRRPRRRRPVRPLSRAHPPGPAAAAHPWMDAALLRPEARRRGRQGLRLGARDVGLQRRGAQPGHPAHCHEEPAGGAAGHGHRRHGEQLHLPLHLRPRVYLGRHARHRRRGRLVPGQAALHQRVPSCRARTSPQVRGQGGAHSARYVQRGHRAHPAVGRRRDQARRQGYAGLGPARRWRLRDAGRANLPSLGCGAEAHDARSVEPRWQGGPALLPAGAAALAVGGRHVGHRGGRRTHHVAWQVRRVAAHSRRRRRWLPRRARAERTLRAGQAGRGHRREVRRRRRRHPRRDRRGGRRRQGRCHGASPAGHRAVGLDRRGLCRLPAPGRAAYPVGRGPMEAARLGRWHDRGLLRGRGAHRHLRRVRLVQLQARAGRRQGRRLHGPAEGCGGLRRAGRG